MLSRGGPRPTYTGLKMAICFEISRWSSAVVKAVVKMSTRHSGGVDSGQTPLGVRGFVHCPPGHLFLHAGFCPLGLFGGRICK